MGYFDDDELYEDIDREEDELEDGETLEELDVDENGHVVEGRRNRRRNRDDEYEPDFEEMNPDAYGYEDEFRDSED